jgi:hypothetical protein
VEFEPEKKKERKKEKKWRMKNICFQATKEGQDSGRTGRFFSGKEEGGESGRF